MARLYKHNIGVKDLSKLATNGRAIAVAFIGIYLPNARWRFNQ